MTNDSRWRRATTVLVATALAAGTLNACRSGGTPAAATSAPPAVASSPESAAVPGVPRPSAGAPDSEFQTWVGRRCAPR